MSTNTNTVENKLGIHLPTAPSKKEKHSYALKHTWLLKFLFVSEILVMTQLYFGHISFFQNSLLYWVFLFGLATFMYAYRMISVFINLQYKEFDMKKHDKFVEKFWHHNTTKYKVDIFLPICGEDPAVLENTWAGVKHLQNDHYEYNAFILDDGNDPKAKELAERFGFTYWVRPNRGEMKKAGNLKHAFNKTNGDFIVILDADFVPRHDFVLDTLPYMIGSQFGIVQTPQFFDHNHHLHNQSMLESGAGNVQEYFYKIIQPSRSALNGAICVGSCALYKREALNVIGGTAQVEHSEDVITGFRLLAQGWNLKYLPIPLSKGVCPSDMHAFFKQQTRWCSGSMSLLRSKAFWEAKIPFYTKMCFVSGFMYYISNPVTMLLLFQSIVVLAFDQSIAKIEMLYIFIPTFIVSATIQLVYIYPNPKIGTVLARACSFWYYSYTLVALLFGIVEGWAPTGSKQKLSNGFVFTVISSSAFLFFYSISIFAVSYFGHVNFGNPGLYPLFGWIGFVLFYHLNFWVYSINHLNENHRESLPWYITQQKWLLPVTVYTVMVGLVWAFTPGFFGDNKVAIADTPAVPNGIVQSSNSFSSPQSRLATPIQSIPNIASLSSQVVIQSSNQILNSITNQSVIEKPKIIEIEAPTIVQNNLQTPVNYTAFITKSTPTNLNK